MGAQVALCDGRGAAQRPGRGRGRGLWESRGCVARAEGTWGGGFAGVARGADSQRLGIVEQLRHSSLEGALEQREGTIWSHSACFEGLALSDAETAFCHSAGKSIYSSQASLRIGALGPAPLRMRLCPSQIRRTERQTER